MSNDFEQIFMCLLALCIPFLEEGSIQTFCPFLNEFIFLFRSTINVIVFYLLKSQCPCSPLPNSWQPDLLSISVALPLLDSNVDGTV